MRPHRWQPTRPLRPWDFLGKSTGVGCHCLLRLSLNHRSADKKLGLSLWGGFACPCVSPGAVVRSVGLSWKSAWGRGALGAHVGVRGGGGAPGVRQGRGVPVVLSGVAIAAGNAHFMCSWVPSDQHPVSGTEGYRPQVRELGLSGAGNHIFHPLCWHSLGAP